MTVAEAAELVPCHVGNFHGQRWVFGPQVATALRDANRRLVAQQRRYTKQQATKNGQRK
jgi:hypothetical protein